MAGATFLAVWHQLLPKLSFRVTGSLLSGLSRSTFQETFSGNTDFNFRALSYLFYDLYSPFYYAEASGFIVGQIFCVCKTFLRDMHDVRLYLWCK
jgi:hypothetical protein